MADPTTDLRQQLADREADKRHQNISLTLATVACCRRKQGDETIGNWAVLSRQWLTCAQV